MAIKFGRPIERTSLERTISLAPVRTAAPTDTLDLTIRPRRNRRAEWSRRMVCENVLTTARPDLAAVPGRRRQGARAGGLDARRRPAFGR